jgi:hypothetical protein
MRKFFRFSEHNDWEGEVWRFYIPYEGNEQAFGLLETLSIDSPYTVDDNDGELYAEDIVDELVTNSGTGYMRLHNKLDDQLLLCELTVALTSLANHEADLLYKGGIRDYTSKKPENTDASN